MHQEYYKSERVGEDDKKAQEKQTCSIIIIRIIIIIIMIPHNTPQKKLYSGSVPLMPLTTLDQEMVA